MKNSKHTPEPKYLLNPEKHRPERLTDGSYVCVLMDCECEGTGLTNPRTAIAHAEGK